RRRARRDDRARFVRGHAWRGGADLDPVRRVDDDRARRRPPAGPYAAPRAGGHRSRDPGPGEVAMVRSETGRVLVVDDDPPVADVVSRYLVRAGHEVVCVADGHAALRAAEEQPPDLVVLDLMLPGIDGLEVCRRLRERWPVPIVMLTALGEETDRLIGLE